MDPYYRRPPGSGSGSYGGYGSGSGSRGKKTEKIAVISSKFYYFFVNSYAIGAVDLYKISNNQYISDWERFITIKKLLNSIFNIFSCFYITTVLKPKISLSLVKKKYNF
ncbi:MAG: hypothetical protein FJ333_04610 [Sphingomonadales bacterium]|nr:hypothetical protein [Sphingomonadales bacterium]